MIGATPTYYDAEQDSQPQAQDYQRWIENFSQTQLAYPNTPYPPQPSVSDSRPQRQMQSQAPRHTNHYQFVASHHQAPAAPSSDATQYPFFENSQNPTFNSGLPSSQRQSGVTTNWTQPPNAGFGQPPPSSDDAYYLGANQYPGVPDTSSSGQQQHRQQYSSPAELLTALTPGSESTLQSRQSISPAWTDNQPLPQPGTGLPTTPTGSGIFQASPKGKRAPGKPKQRKRQKSETDTDDDDDVMGPNVGANMPRPNRL